MTRTAKGYTARYLAEWISAQRFDASGEWMPDHDEISSTEHSTLQAAQRAAVKGSKAANITEWCRVSHERKSRHGWDTVAIMHGDWRGVWSEWDRLGD